MAEYNAIKAAQLDITVKRGDAATIGPLYLTDPNDSDNPFDLSGFTELTMHIKHRRESSTFLAELTLTGGDLAVSGASNNGLSIVIAAADSNIASRYYFYDVETDDRTTILEGYFIVEEDGTKLSIP